MTASLDEPNPYAAPPSHEGDSLPGASERSGVPGTLSGKFQAAFRMFVADIGIFAPLVLLISLPGDLFINYYAITDPGRETDARLLMVGLLVTLFFGPIPVAGMLYTLKRRMLGEPVNFLDSLSQGMNFWLPLLVFQWIKLSILITGFLLIVPGVYFLVRLALLESVIVLERPDLRDLRRAFGGSKGGDIFDPFLRSHALVSGKGWELFRAMMLFAAGFLSLSLALNAIPTSDNVSLELTIACARASLLELIASVNCVLVFLYYWEAAAAKPPEPVEEEFE